MSIVQAVILAIIEGITEFLPISSTGHMIIASWAMGIAGDPFVKLFTVVVQLGAILSVIVLYYRNFFKSIDFYTRLLAAFLPIVVVAFFLKKYVDIMLGEVLVVGCSLFVGGIVLLLLDRVFPGRGSRSDEGQDDSSRVSYSKAFKIGLFQIIALVPGVSRSAATLVGGLTQGLTRKAAAEFSFFLAVPTMFAATVKELYDTHKHNPELFNAQNFLLLGTGNVIAFIVALLAIRSFVNYLSKHGFRIFGIYRVIVGLTIIILAVSHSGLRLI